ncbi:MAG TPA: ATP synthase F1 subunit delta [Longimicrobiales bacterium]|nr:ATP synthase F1 subunit delta [Longimicrobiales bacterium]
MRDETVARGYAEALFELADRHDSLDGYREAIDAVAGLLDESADFRLFLETPRIGAEAKKAVVRKAFGEELPRPFVNFLLVTIDKRRQRLLRSIAAEYRKLLDAHEGRTYVEVTVARPLDDDTVETLGRRLSDLLGTHVIPHVRVKPEVLGGVVIRAEDTIYDGSLRRRLDRMRRRLLAAGLPEPGAAPGSLD